MCEPIQSGSVCVQVASAQVWLEAPSTATNNCTLITSSVAPEEALADRSAWVQRVRGLRANASKRSHQELNEAPDLDDGDPAELACQYRDLRRRHPHINVLGGCCGTDHRHVEQISAACKAIG